jgi:hypothetical protein
MSRFGFARCPECQRLNIHGARCVCNPLPERHCDCTYDGNKQNIGPGCRQAINDVWAAAIRQSRKIAHALRAEGKTT